MTHHSVRPSESIAKALSVGTWPSVAMTSICVRLLLVRLIGIYFVVASVQAFLPRLVLALSDPNLFIIFERRSALGHLGNAIAWLGSGVVACCTGQWTLKGPFELTGLAVGTLMYFGRAQVLFRILRRSKQ